MTVPAGVECYLYPARCGALLVPGACQSERKFNRQQAHKEWFFSTVCWTWAFLGCQKAEYKKKDEMLNGETAPGIAAWSLWCTEKGSGLISGPNLAMGAQLLSFNRTQSRVFIGLLTGHNTLRRCLCIMGLSNHPIRRKCGMEEETSVHILCECEALASLRYTYLGSFFLDPEDIRKLSMGAIWNFTKGTGLF